MHSFGFEHLKIASSSSFIVGLLHVGQYLGKSILLLLLLDFLITFTTHSFAKTNEYYKQTLTHILTQCNSECQKKVFEQEVHKAFFVLMDAILNQERF